MIAMIFIWDRGHLQFLHGNLSATENTATSKVTAFIVRARIRKACRVRRWAPAVAFC